jgi:hypothetical protein
MSDLLLKMKTEIDSDKNKNSRLEGELDGVMKQLKDQYGLSSEEEAQAEIDKQIEESGIMEASLASRIDKLKTSYTWKTIS